MNESTGQPTQTGISTLVSILILSFLVVAYMDLKGSESCKTIKGDEEYSNVTNLVLVATVLSGLHIAMGLLAHSPLDKIARGISERTRTFSPNQRMFGRVAPWMSLVLNAVFVVAFYYAYNNLNKVDDCSTRGKNHTSVKQIVYWGGILSGIHLGLSLIKGSVVEMGIRQVADF
jgi:hypothetical protein